MEVKPVRFSDGEYVQTVAVYKGIPLEELSRVLSSVFGIEGTVIGFVGEDGMVVPISLCCRSPEVFYGSVYKILTTEDDVQYITSPQALSVLPITEKVKLLPPPPLPTSTSLVSVSTPPVAPIMPPNVPMTRPPERRESRASAARHADMRMSDEAMDQVLRFISGLRVRALVTKEEAQSLEELLFEDSTLIFAAYSVASNANDAEYLAEICIDLTQSLKTPEGLAALSAQEDLLHVCDSLFSIDKITKNQLLYLRHLVLIREELVATIYDDYQRHQSIDRMANDLLEAATKSTALTAFPTTAEDFSTGDLEEDEDSVTNNPPTSIQRVPSRPPAPSPMSSTLNSMIAQMMRTSQISSSEAAILLEMVNQENQYVLAAYEIYEQDGDDDELKDTLMRCAKLETRKRILSSRDSRSGTTALSPKSTQQYQQQAQSLDDSLDEYLDDSKGEEEGNQGDEGEEGGEEDIEYEDDFEDDENNVNANATLSINTTAATASNNKDGNYKSPSPKNISSITTTRFPGEEDHDDDDEDDDDDDGDGDDDDADNQDEGDKEEEEDFTHTSFSEPLARHLEDLLSSIGVENTWSDAVPQQFIFTVFAAAHKNLMSIGQSKALCDLFQAGYDLVRAAWEVYSVQGDVRDFTDTLLRIVRDLAFDENGDVEVTRDGDDVDEDDEVDQRGRSSAGSHTIAESESSLQAAHDKAQQKKRARAAVEDAKRDLLKHSLEMMIKQDMTTPENAAALFERCLKGDVLVDAAIEGYATSRDVGEFLDTLQILANNSLEDLEAAMRSAVIRQTNQNSVETQGVSVHTEEETQPEVPARPSPAKSRQSPAAQIHPTLAAAASPVVRSPGAASAFSASSPPRSPVQQTSSGTQTNSSTGASATSSRSPAYGVGATRATSAPSPLGRPAAVGNSTVNSGNSSVDAHGNALSPSRASQEATAHAELRAIVGQMSSENDIDADGRVALFRLIASSDERVMAAYDVYRELHDRQYLVDSLTRIARREEQRSSPQKYSSPNRMPSIQIDESSDDEDEDDDDDDEDDYGDSEDDDDEDEDDEEGDDGDDEGDERDRRGGDEGDEDEDQVEDEEEDEETTSEVVVPGGVLSAGDQKNILGILERASALSKEAVTGLTTLIMQGDTKVHHIFLQYEGDKDVYRLIEALKRVELPSEGLSGQEVEEETLREEEEEDEEDDDELDETGREYMDSRFLAIVKTMNLSHLETAALRLAIARDDGAIRTALETFRTSFREDELIEDLRRIAKNTIEDTMLEADADGEDVDEITEERDSSDRLLTASMVARDDGDEEGEGEADRSYRANEQGLMSNQAARDHVFPILIGELVKEDILKPADGSRILQQFLVGNAVIDAALDNYDLDSDMAELVDTLQRVATALEGQ